jgi:hypothetical protein
MLVKVEDCCEDAFVMRIYYDEAGDLFLSRGWVRLSCDHHLSLSYVLFLTFDGHDFLFVKVFNIGRCRVVYNTSGAAAEASQVPGT